MKNNKAKIKAIFSYLPEQKISNDQLEQDYPNWNAQKISEKTGISIRGVSDENECASDLGIKAAQRLFKSGICNPEDTDFLLFCTQSPDHFLPTTACIIQDKLKLPTSCGALDFNLGCSGFVYGLSIAKGLIETGTVQNVLLITAETYTKFIHPSDRKVRTIFSDGAAATLIHSEETNDEAIGPFIFGTDGRGAKNLIVPAGGLRQMRTPETAVERETEKGVFRSDQNLYMDGPEIFNFTLKAVPKAVTAILDKSQLEMKDVDYFVFHQANKFVLNHLRRKTNIPKEKFCINLDSYGNTVSSTIPMALELALQQGKIKNGYNVMIVGFGVGYSWASAIIKF